MAPRRVGVESGPARAGRSVELAHGVGSPAGNGPLLIERTGEVRAEGQCRVAAAARGARRLVICGQSMLRSLRKA